MKSMKALISGAAAAVATMVIAALMPRAMALELLAAVLFAIAAVYLGYALVDGRKRELLIELANIGVTVGLALLGLWAAPIWLAVGYLTHGLWDAAHHPWGVQTAIPRWYIPFCLIYDWMVR